MLRTAIVIATAMGFLAAEPAQAPERPSAAGPRLGTIYELEVEVGPPENLRRLDGFDIGNYRRGVATVYATAAERDRLAARGFDFRLVPPQEDDKVLGLYHDYEALTAELEAFADAYPEITRLYSLGTSVEGRELWALLITDNPDVEEDEPEFKYVSTMHGDEPVGTELLLYFIDWLLRDYGRDPRITALVDETAVWIVPCMNPDGLERRRRYNAQGFDLNRAFPEYPVHFAGTLYDTPLNTAGRPPEVARIMEWTAENRFVLSANLHTGALLVNYPYDDDGVPSGTDAPTPDNALFRDLALRYAVHNVPMYTNPDDPDSPSNPDGITNGAAWYVITGSMQDWNYRYAGCFEVTLELSEIKRPSALTLAGLWEDNAESLLVYAESVHRGVRGRVTDGRTGDPLSAKVRVEGNSQPVFTDPDVGDYHRLLLPGEYTLVFSAPGYLPVAIEGVGVDDGPATRLDVELIRPSVDVNGDGRTDALDVQVVVNGALGRPAPPEADIDGGGITATDVQLVINAVLAL